MHLLCRALLIVGFMSSADAAWAGFAAIAYSPSTGCYGYASNCCSRAEAERVAIRNCRGCDACCVVWVENGYIALAVGTCPGDSVGWAYSTCSRADAEALALTIARLRKCAQPRIATSVYSGR